MAKTQNQQPSKRKSAAASRELSFGGTWRYEAALDSVEHVVIAKRYDLFVGGEFVRPKSGKYFATNNPATQQPLAEVALGNQKDVDAAVQAAQKALPA